MITTVLAAALLHRTPLQVEEFFPLQAGMIKIYDEEIVSNGKKFKINIVETYKGISTLKRYEEYFDANEPEVEKRNKVREHTREGFEVLTSMDNQTPESTYYQVSGDRIFIIGTEPGQLLVEVYPVFAVGPQTETFIFSGNIPVMGAPAPALIDGETKRRGDYKFNGKNYPAVETKLNYRINLGGGIDVTSEQKAIYAKGLGIVEFEETGKSGSRSTKRKRKLTKIQIP